MNLTSTQKQQLQQLFSNTNICFFSFLDRYEYEKKYKKLKNAKEEYAKYGYDEEVLFLLDETLFGSADYGMVITDSFVFCKDMFGDPKHFQITHSISCKYIEDNKILINYQELIFALLRESTFSVVNIINKLSEFYKENIIKEKNLDLYLNIAIPQSLSISGGMYKDIKNGYNIPITQGIQDGTILSLDGYGKSYGDIKGKLMVTVHIEKPKPTPMPVYKEVVKPKFKTEPKNIIVDCINCGKQHINPRSYNCSFCGKSLTTKVEVKKKNPTELELQIENDNSVDVEDLELIVTCVNCSKDIKNYSSNICPHCGEDANIKKKKTATKEKKVKKVVEKTSSASEFYLEIDDEITVKDIKNLFFKYTGLVLRVYESSRKQARSNKKLINLATKKTTVKVTVRMKIETIIEKFQEIGVKVRIASFDDSKFCNSNFTLAKAKDGG